MSVFRINDLLDEAFSGARELYELDQEYEECKHQLNLWPSESKQYRVLQQNMFEVIERKKSTGKGMTYNTAKLKDLSKAQLVREKEVYVKSLTLFSPPEHFAEIIATTNKHIEVIDTYIKQADMWELVGVDQDDDTTEQ